jgi:hypothetical protein
MILAPEYGAMKRGLWLIFTALAVFAATALFRYDPEPVAALESSPVPSEPPAAVRVSHEFVTVEIPTPAVQRLRPRSETGPQTILATHDGSDSIERRETMKAVNRVVGPAARPASSRDQNLLARAGRALVGDGKYRPEPFPRIK